MRITSKIPFSFSLRVGDAPPSPPTQVSQPQSQAQPNKISPAVLFIIVIIAIIFFISGLLHLLLRLLTGKQPAPASDPGPPLPPPDTTQRQLQQLFHFHDSGLDQTIIDSLPVFLYQDILLGPKDPFDCAVCLSEFLGQDQLRLLPDCGHAFHLQCIDTWLLSNSTCPLCRASLALLADNTDYLFGEAFQEDASSQYPPHHAKLQEEDKILYSIRLGKFTSLSKPENVTHADQQNESEIADTSSSSSNLDARRCFSMGSYQYILANSTLQVPCTSARGRSMRFVGTSTTTRNEVPDERKLSANTRGESLSVSKIWQRPGQKGDFGGNSSLQGNSVLVRLPVMEEKGYDS